LGRSKSRAAPQGQVSQEPRVTPPTQSRARHPGSIPMSCTGSITVPAKRGSESLSRPFSESTERQGLTQAYQRFSSGMWTRVCLPGEAAQGSKGLLVHSSPKFVNTVNAINLAISVNVNSMSGHKIPKKTNKKPKQKNQQLPLYLFRQINFGFF